jgi:hypothetical protein
MDHIQIFQSIYPAAIDHRYISQIKSQSGRGVFLDGSGLKYFSGGQADMVGGDDLGLLGSRGDEGASGQVIGFAEEAAGSLLDGGDCGLLQRIGFQASQSQMMSQVVGHFLPGHTLEMAAGDDSGSQGPGGAKDQLIDQGALPGQDDGQVGFGVLIELGEQVEFRQDLQAQEGGLIDDQNRLDFFTFIEGADFLLDETGQDGPGVTGFFDMEIGQKEAVEIQDGTRGGGDGEDLIFRRVKTGGHIT